MLEDGWLPATTVTKALVGLDHGGGGHQAIELPALGASWLDPRDLKDSARSHKSIATFSRNLAEPRPQARGAQGGWEARDNQTGAQA